ncbi:MAG TPA: c-type cytochrome [Vicinamibacterales bacterium]|nr:c-type cytochrome [Vicinamibacterales bacterium]
MAGNQRLTRHWLCLIAIAAAAQSSSFAQSKPPHQPLGIGRAATPEEIAKLDIDVRPDGKGLPEGRGSVADGAKVYAAKCASCHGKNGEGASFDRLVATDSGKNFDFAINPKLPRAVGNYWPYATTLYDYTYRAMPFMQPGTLSADETYAVVAYILHLNKIVPENAVMDRTTLPAVKMPARDRFVMDNRKGGKVVK